MTQKKEEFLDIKQFFYRIVSNWLLFLLSILLCLAIAFGFNRYTKNIFKVSSTILFEDQSNISSISAAEAIYSNDPFQRSSKNIIANKIYEINSYPLIYQTLNDLNYDIEYYLVGNILPVADDPNLFVQTDGVIGEEDDTGIPVTIRYELSDNSETVDIKLEIEKTYVTSPTGGADLKFTYDGGVINLSDMAYDVDSET